MTKGYFIKSVIYSYLKFIRLKKSVQIAFDLFDEKNNNEIPTIELERILCSIGHNLPTEELAELASEIDKKNKGSSIE